MNGQPPFSEDHIETAPPVVEPTPWWVCPDGFVGVGLRMEILRTVGVEVEGSNPKEMTAWLEAVFQWVIYGAGAPQRPGLTPIQGGKQPGNSSSPPKRTEPIQ